MDGFNLYYGVLRNTACKWLDLQRFFTLLRPNDDVRAIRTTVYVPARDPKRGAALELRKAAHKAKTPPQELLRVAQLPLRLQDGSGGSVQRPKEW